MGIIRLVAFALAGIAGLGSFFARVVPSHWQLLELMLVVGFAALISRRLSTREKLSPAKVPVSSRAGWYAGLPADLRDAAARNFHPYDVEQAARRSAALSSFPMRPVTRVRRSPEQVSEEALAHVFHS